MKTRLAVLLCGGALLAAAPTALAASPIKVGIRIEGAHRTLVPQEQVTLADAPVPPKDGDPSHTCPGQSALGAIQAGTHGDWNGTYSDGLGYFVTAIDGETPSGSSFFSLWVNHKLSKTGACGATLHAGDHVLVFVDNSDTPVTPLGLRVASHIRRGQKFVIHVFAYSASGKTHPIHGAKVYANGKPLKGKTNKSGHLTVRATHSGRVSFYARRAGNAKSGLQTIKIRKA